METSQSVFQKNISGLIKRQYFNDKLPAIRLHFINFFVLTFAVFFSLSVQASAKNSYFEFSVGSSQLDVSGYSKPLVKQVSMGTQVNDLIFEASLLEIEPFEILSDTSNYISIKGFSLHAFKPIVFFNRLMIAPGLGIFRWDADVYRYGDKAGEDSGFSSQLFGVLGFQITDNFALRTTASYLREVSGTNIRQLSFSLLVSY